MGADRHHRDGRGRRRGGTLVGAHLRRARPPLRARGRPRPATGLTGDVHRVGRRAGPLARAGCGAPGQSHPPHRTGPADPAGLRLVPHERAARCGGQREPRRRCPARVCGAHDRGPGLLARPRRLPRRPDLRGRHAGGDAGVHRRTPPPRRAARRGDQGLRRVRRAVPPGVEQPGEPMAPVDPAVGDDLRRPRRPGRLEHLVGVAPAHARHAVVARAHRRGTGVVLGLSAHRQPLAGPARRGRAVAGRRRARVLG